MAISTRGGSEVVSIAWLDEHSGEASCVLRDPKTGQQWARVVHLSHLLADDGIPEIRKAAKRIVESG